MNQAVCLVLVGVFWSCNVQSLSLFDSPSQYDVATGVVGQCRRTCGVQKLSLWNLNGLKLLCSPCFVKCVFHGLRAKAAGNGSTTSSPTTSSAKKLWYSSTTPSTVKPITTVDSNNDCPPNSPPGPGEIVPGHVRDVAVKFVHGINRRWVAEVTWSPPEGCNITSNWRGYLPMWVSVDDFSDAAVKAVRCQPLPKNQTKFVIDEAKGWKHPYTLYLAVVALPTNKVTFVMSDFSPPVPGLNYPITPIEVNDAGHKPFSLTSSEGLAILFVAFIVVVFFCLWILKVSCCLKNARQKKANKKMDDLKKQLVV